MFCCQSTKIQVRYFYCFFFPSPGDFFFPAKFLQTGVPRKQGSKQASKQARQGASEQARTGASKQASQQASQLASQPASKGASERASRQARQQASKQARKGASEQARKGANEQASKQANKQASMHCSSKNDPAVGFWLQHKIWSSWWIWNIFFYAQTFVGSMIRTLNPPTQQIGFRILTR